MSWQVKAVQGIEAIGAVAWNQFAEKEGVPRDPFLSYAFLSALEESGSVSNEVGWMPYHLLLENEDQSPLGVMPLYVKGHSQGEYIFDYSWADALERAGGRYYPKLLSAIPFTPVTGRRILAETSEQEQALVMGAAQMAEELNISSVHVNFLDEHAWRRRGDEGWLLRTHKQYHWQNQDYGSFDDFLSCLSSKKRKNIKRERRLALAAGITIECLTGSEILESHWDAFYQFYIDTGHRKWGSPYLNRQFFSLIGQSMAEDILLVMCRRGDKYVAGAINFIGETCLYGRNWGCIEDHPFLHFEVCYYQAIEFAIHQGLSRVEAGAQGEHKLARGYLPSQTYSAHWIVHEGFREAVSRYLDQERSHVTDEIDYLERFSPFKSAS
ncbi:MAG: N-acetyltransferase [Pseudomonadales bacterium]|jgi:predicted N-acyltransferase|nr:N-acetyltransferase [Pseudomonadales bacterium]MDA0760754.1 GNAT family N-acetyltransferase [Pseudomonadota bacterium]MDA0956369.1 GNAT family N-acetyltransferase [Pseudomonadota bacterium]